MVVWSVISQKGGSGKTTLVLHLAIAASRKGRVTSVIDLDPQKSAEKWSAVRESMAGENEPVIVHGTPGGLAGMLATARKDQTEVVLVDTPPAVDKSMLFAAAAADVVVVPTRASVLDRFALEETLQFLEAARALDKCVVLLNSARGADDEGVAAVETLVRRHGVRMVTTSLENLSELSTTIDSGRGITEARPRSKAAHSIDAVYRYLTTRSRRTAKPNARR